MDVKTKQRPKKRRTRKNLDDLRERSRRVKNNVNKISDNKCKNIPKYNNELITCNRLTLSLFRKAIRSKTATRLPFTKIDNKNYRNGKTINNNLLLSPQTQNPSKESIIISENNNALESSGVNNLFKKHASEIVNGKNDPPSCSPLSNGFKNIDSSPEQGNYKCEYLNNWTSDSNSEVESIHCSYEKFMNEMPAYLEEHFPALNKKFRNENLVHLKHFYLKNSCWEQKSNSSDDNYPTVDTPQNHRSLIIQNPLDYIQTGLTWEQSVQTKQRSPPNSCSPPLAEAHSNISGIFLNSPDYQYFPHKLNQ